MKKGTLVMLINAGPYPWPNQPPVGACGEVVGLDERDFLMVLFPHYPGVTQPTWDGPRSYFIKINDPDIDLSESTEKDVTKELETVE